MGFIRQLFVGHSKGKNAENILACISFRVYTPAIRNNHYWKESGPRKKLLLKKKLNILVFKDNILYVPATLLVRRWFNLDDYYK